jgi:hypothetical protein
MTGETSEALDQALWLHEAPGRRRLLQARPLAEGQELLLRIAADSGSALETAAAATGQPVQRIGEATRFYLQQVLFTEDADAYRVLGLQRGASADQIRHHHRLLQRWLHPDRSEDPWNEVFAARVNQAWTALRDPARRAQYDAGLPALPATAPAPATGWQAATPEQATRDPARWLAYAAIVGCAALVSALFLRNEEPPAWGDGPSAIQVPPTAADTAVAASDAAGSPEQPRRNTRRPAAPTLAAAAAAKAPPAPVAHTLADPLPIALAGVEAPRLPLPAGQGSTVPERGVPAPPAAAAIGREADGAPVALQRALAEVSRTTTLPQRSVTLEVELPPSTVVAPAATPAPGVVIPQVPATMLAATPEDALHRDPLLVLQQAEASLRRAVAYLADPARSPPPLWNSVRAAEGGADQQAGLRARLPAPAPQIELSGNHWVLGEDRARFGADYTARAGRAGSETGRISLELVRREQLWLVADLRLEPAP